MGFQSPIIDCVLSYHISCVSDSGQGQRLGWGSLGSLTHFKEEQKIRVLLLS